MEWSGGVHSGQFWAFWAILGILGKSGHFGQFWLNLWKRQQICPECPELPKMPRFAQNAQNCPNCPDLPRTAQNCPKCPDCPKCLKLPKMPRIAQISVLLKNSERKFFWDTLYYVLISPWDRQCLQSACCLLYACPKRLGVILPLLVVDLVGKLEYLHKLDMLDACVSG